MPQEPFHLIQVYPGLNHSRCEPMAKLMEMKTLNLCIVEGDGQRSPDVAPIEGRLAFAVENDISRPLPRRLFTFRQSIRFPM
jgi:hypothetical protein